MECGWTLRCVASTAARSARARVRQSRDEELSYVKRLNYAIAAIMVLLRRTLRASNVSSPYAVRCTHCASSLLRV